MSTDPRASCLVADDHPALAAAVCTFLADHGFAVVGPFPDGRSAVAAAEEVRPDLALLDYRMPHLAGTALLERIREVSPHTRIAVYTADAGEHLAREALAAGATGIVLKEAPLGDVARALTSILAGRSYVDSGLSRLSHPGTGRPGSGELTARELDVLRLLAEGLSHEEIGSRLQIGSETVRTHARKAAGRLGATTRTQAVAIALRLGLIT